MSVSLRKSFAPQFAQTEAAGSSASAEGVRQASMPSRSINATTARFSSVSMSGLLHCSQRKTAMGTSQIFWRLMHQSGRVAIMLVMRTLPQLGSQTTLSISSMASCRKVVSVPSERLTGVSMPINHCSVAR
jgi:hypothetical protein